MNMIGSRNNNFLYRYFDDCNWYSTNQKTVEWSFQVFHKYIQVTYYFYPKIITTKELIFPGLRVSTTNGRHEY